MKTSTDASSEGNEDESSLFVARDERRTMRARAGGGEHTRRRAIFHDLGNAPYRRRESFDAAAHERAVAVFCAGRGSDDDDERDAMASERRAMTARAVRALEVGARGVDRER